MTPPPPPSPSVREPRDGAARGSVAAAAPPSLRETLRRWWWLALPGALVAGAAVYHREPLFTAWEALIHGMGRLDSVALILAMAFLPMGGFSISVVYLLAGAKFGPLWGGVVVAAVTAIHLLGMHVIGRGVLRGPVDRFLRRGRHRLPEIPEGENAAIALMAALVPGPPYFARNYLLALAGVPLRIYFWVCLPVYLARAYIVILFGDMSGELSGTRLAVFAAVYGVKLSVCAWVIAHLRRRHARRRAEVRG